MSEVDLIKKFFEEDEEFPCKVLKVEKSHEDSSGNNIYEVEFEELSGKKGTTEVGVIGSYVVIVPT